MNEWFTKFVQTNPATQQLLPPLNPQPIPVAPQAVKLLILNKPLLLLTTILRESNSGLKIQFGDTAYQCWNILISVVPRERVTWEIFQAKFRKKYINQRFIDQKQKGFLKLKQDRMSVSEYEREFARLNKYARECVSTEAIMCKRFEDELNEDISLVVGSLELKEFVVLVDKPVKLKNSVKKREKLILKQEIRGRD
ncbi:Protein MCM10 [Gossypium australe]|uniref:Protein MCM10 n=1 Tax=Gossypium australe TaxID=47621 RepID=A0A5B6WI42_9ROSI|nr:Protein MCM10 [Gossypium australe]